jgi:hypothetical protein
MIESIIPYETLDLTRATRHDISEHDILITFYSLQHSNIFLIHEYNSECGFLLCVIIMGVCPLIRHVLLQL